MSLFCLATAFLTVFTVQLSISLWRIEGNARTTDGGQPNAGRVRHSAADLCAGFLGRDITRRRAELAARLTQVADPTDAAPLDQR
jgi:hypothetical protein